MNCLPLSEIIVFGNPNLHTMFFYTKDWTLLAMIEAKGSASIHLVK